jgi:hypothetical protein
MRATFHRSTPAPLKTVAYLNMWLATVTRDVSKWDKFWSKARASQNMYDMSVADEVFQYVNGSLKSDW